MGYQHNANKLPEGKICPKVGGKEVVQVMHAVIDGEARSFKVILEDWTTAIIPESDLVDIPKEEEGK